MLPMSGDSTFASTYVDAIASKDVETILANRGREQLKQAQSYQHVPSMIEGAPARQLDLSSPNWPLPHQAPLCRSQQALVITCRHLLGPQAYAPQVVNARPRRSRQRRQQKERVRRCKWCDALAHSWLAGFDRIRGCVRMVTTNDSPAVMPPKKQARDEQRASNLDHFLARHPCSPELSLSRI